MADPDDLEERLHRRTLALMERLAKDAPPPRPKSAEFKAFIAYNPYLPRGPRA